MYRLFFRWIWEKVVPESIRNSKPVRWVANHRKLTIWVIVTVWINFFPATYEYDIVHYRKYSYWYVDDPWYSYARFLLPLILGAVFLFIPPDPPEKK
ncbi:hypothetical protein [Neisseria lactamica]|uniref:hypothetical protein n=1 Tax=Neisseria lactamica TaxID=486 RepID=UPI000E577831|nr:hypothetical protein [Neisseria lactamica]